MASFRDQVQKKGGGKKKKCHFTLAQYIYLCNVIVSLFVSQIVASKNTYYFICYRKKEWSNFFSKWH